MKKTGKELSDIFKHWVENIMKDLSTAQSDRALLLNGYGWYPSDQSADKVLKRYYEMEYVMRKINYLIRIKNPILSEDKTATPMDLLEFFHLLDKYNVSTPFFKKYKEKFKLHYPDLF